MNELECPSVMTELYNELRRFKACKDALDWICHRTPQEAWEQCGRGDWLLWWAAKIGVDQRLIVWAACDCAESVLHYVPSGEHRPRIAIETARRWVAGDATEYDVRCAAFAASAAYAAADAADAAYHAAASAANAAYHAAASAANAATYATYAANAATYATYAANAATYATYAAYAADAADAAYAAVYYTDNATNATVAILVRSRIPWDTVCVARNKMNLEDKT